MIDFILFVLRSWKIWLTFSVAGAAIAAVSAFMTEPTYRSQVVLAPASTSQGQGLAASLGPLSDVAAMTGLNLAGAMQEKVEALATLQSKKVIIEFIEERNLRPVLFPESWDASAEQWISADPVEIPTNLQAYEKFTRDILGVVESQTTGLVTVTVDWKDPSQASEWGNALVSSVNRTLRERAISDAEQSIAFLNKELERATNVELKSSIYRLIETQLEQRMLATVREDFAFRVIDPAVERAAWEYSSPNRLLMILGGAVLGFLVGLVLARELTGDQRRG